MQAFSGVDNVGRQLNSNKKSSKLRVNTWFKRVFKFMKVEARNANNENFMKKKLQLFWSLQWQRVEHQKLSNNFYTFL